MPVIPIITTRPTGGYDFSWPCGYVFSSLSFSIFFRSEWEEKWIIFLFFSSLKFHILLLQNHKNMIDKISKLCYTILA